jgi:hypothetical protein
MMRIGFVLAGALAELPPPTSRAQNESTRATASKPVAIGETFTIDSRVVAERRRIKTHQICDMLQGFCVYSMESSTYSSTSYHSQRHRRQYITG